MSDPRAVTDTGTPKRRPSATAAGPQLKISQEQLAQFLGLSRQIVNKHLQTWKRKNWIALGRGSVTIANERALRSVTLQN